MCFGTEMSWGSDYALPFQQHPRPPGYSSSAPHHLPTVGGRPDVHRAPQLAAVSSSVTRSSSVPRTQAGNTRADQSEEAQTYNSSVRRLSSPNAFTDPLNGKGKDKDLSH